MVDRRLVQPERDERPQLEPDRLARQQPVADVRRVLQVRHQHALLELRRPRRRRSRPAARLELEAGEVAATLSNSLPSGGLG